jgi:DNA polymerase-3 subunit gamma/tau
MASLALYRKYRPQTFEEVIGQEHVTRTLRNALQDGRIVHAYLFAGPRGTGKTTTARLLAKAVNCLDEDLAARPCNRCAICQAINEGHLLDLIEIDAASNRGIDEIREIRERVNFRPNEARYKVYVVDEVHMLTEHAFNALLKTLEEPPPHALFVLATTDPQKVPATVLSRCQRFDFRRVPLNLIVEHLAKIARAEGVEVEPAALDLIARQATGSVRDAVSLLDQLFAFCEGRVSVRDVEAVLGSVPAAAVSGLVEALLARDVPRALRLVDDLARGGTDLAYAARSLVEHLRGLLLLRVGGEARLLNRAPEEVAAMQEQARRAPAEELVRWVRVFQRAVEEMKGDLLPQIPLELACVEACLGAEGAGQAAPVAPAPAVAPAPGPAVASAPAGPASARTSRTPGEVPAAREQASPRPAPEAARPAAPGTKADAATLKAAWGRVLAEVRPHSRQVEAVLRGSCEPLSIEDGVVTIGFYHQFHKGQVEEARNRELVQEAISRVLGAPHRIRCVLVQGGARAQGPGPRERRPPPPPEPPPEAPTPEVERPAAPARGEQEDLDGAYRAVAADPLIQEAVTRYGAQVVDIVNQGGEGSWGTGEEAPEVGGTFPEAEEDDGQP